MVRNRIYKRGILLFVVIFLMSFTMVERAKAAPNRKQRVYDLAELLTFDEKEDLEKIADKYSTKRETDFIILTTNNEENKDIVIYMEDFYDENALGYDKPHGNTAILTIDMKNREVYLAGFYKGKEYLNDYRLDLIQDKIAPDLSEGNYYEAFRSFIKISYKYMGIRPGVDPNNILFNIWFQIIASLGVAGISVGIMMYNSGGKVTVGEGTYRDFSNSRVIDRRDNYLRTTVSKRRKPSNNNNSSGGGSRGGGGGGGVSRGGHSHSGSRGKF